MLKLSGGLVDELSMHYPYHECFVVGLLAYLTHALVGCRSWG